MAGIGFRLQALVDRGSYLEASAAYLSSALVTAGPWLAGTLALLVLRSTAATFLRGADHTLLFATIIMVYVTSLLVTAGPQMVISRYLADRLYVQDYNSIASSCAGMLLFVLPLTLLATPFLLFAPFDLRYRLLVTTLFVLLALTWLVMVCLTATQSYWRLLFIFTCGYAVSIGAAIFLGSRQGLSGCLAGFSLGQFLCLALLLINVYKEFPGEQGINLHYLKAFIQYWDLLLTGVFYMLGLWIDSMLLWFSSHGTTIQGFYHLFPPYDSTKLIAALSSIPIAVVFMIHVETNFHRHYQRFYQLAAHKGTLQALARERQAMWHTALRGLMTMLKIQLFIALALCLLVPYLDSLLGLEQKWNGLLYIQIFAGGAQFFVFLALLLILYLDQRKTALLLATGFLLGNLGFSLLAMRLGEGFYGTGLLVSAVLSSIIGWLMLRNRLMHLEYLTFMAAL